ncbi:MAG: hypothetical protein QG673_2260 [Pseudomonadota bacterium]|nr:hypothetical protein [Pseudomonadota bacterium]
MNKKIDLDKIKIRLADESDLAAVVNLLADDELGKNREVVDDNRNTDYGVSKNYLTAYNRIKNDPNHMLVVMDYFDEIVGTLQFIIIPTLTFNGCTRAEIEGVRIKSAYRQLGLGKFFFKWVKETALKNNCGIIQLTTNNARVGAQSFYKSLGFVDSHCGMKMMLEIDKIEIDKKII